MSESITLSAPVVADPRSANTLNVEAVLFNWKDKRIVIHVGDGTLQKMVTYVDISAGPRVSADPVATNLMIALNKANLSVKSLHKRILERLVADGHIAGNITGTPD